MNRREEYLALLRDPRWQKKRLEILERDNWACLECGDKTKTLHVHHLFYNVAPWMTYDFGLRTLCEDCHEGASRVQAGEGGIDQYFWSALVLMDELRKKGLDPSEVLNFAFQLSEATQAEFDAARFQLPSCPPPPSQEEIDETKRKSR